MAEVPGRPAVILRRVGLIHFGHARSRAVSHRSAAVRIDYGYDACRGDGRDRGLQVM